ncbi:MAG: phenylalanine 4-monooxygenase [Bryobacteraceae bacterium]
MFIEQRYERYTAQDHETWRALYARMLPLWRAHATPRFLAGLESLALDPNAVPRLEDVNRFLHCRTGFRSRAVGGYVPAFHFFDCLRQRIFPTTITVRPPEQIDYLPEPDIFHDLAGHVPMHADPVFADVLARFGECAIHAAEGPREVLASRIRAMARFFWFTIEFGLMETSAGMKVYGSGLLSSHGEIVHAVESSEVKRRPLDLEQVVNQPFDIDRYQPLLYVVRGFEHLYEEVSRLEQWMKLGRLDRVAGGNPEVSAEDLESFAGSGVPEAGGAVSPGRIPDSCRRMAPPEIVEACLN